MTYADAFNLRLTSLNYNNVADAIDGVLSRANGGTTAGTSTAYTATCTPAWTAYEQGRIIAVVPNTDNTGSTTLNVNSLGVRTIKYKNQNLIGGEMLNGVTAFLVVTAADFELLNHAGGWRTWTPTGAGAFPSVLTVNFARYQRHGNLIHFQYNVQATTTSAVNNCDVILPVAAAALGTTQTFAVSVTQGASFLAGFGLITSGSTTSGVYRYDSSNYSSGVTVVARGAGTYIV